MSQGISAALDHIASPYEPVFILNFVHFAPFGRRNGPQGPQDALTKGRFWCRLGTLGTFRTFFRVGAHARACTRDAR